MRCLEVRIAPLPCILNGVGTAVSVLKLLESTNQVITFRITLTNDGLQKGTNLSAVKIMLMFCTPFKRVNSYIFNGHFALFRLETHMYSQYILKK